MEDKVCLDSDFIVNFLRGRNEEVQYILENESRIIFGTTLINLFELYLGAYRYGSQKRLEKVNELKDRLVFLNMSIESCRKAGKIAAELKNKGEDLDYRDVLIACIACQEGFAIKTNNKKHFERIPDLVLL